MASKWWYRLLPMTGSGKDTDPFRPNLPAGESYVLLAQQGSICLVKQRVDEKKTFTPGEGVVAEADTEQPFTTDKDGVVTYKPWGVRGTTAFSAPEAAAIKSWLSGNGFGSDAPSIGVGVKNRQDLMNLFLTRFPGITLQLMSTGFDVAG